MSARCPRCAYDLAGQADARGDSGPATGRCPECGLEFRWEEVLDPLAIGPAWSFEHGRARLAARYAATLFRVLLSRRAWRELTLTAATRPARLAVFALATALLTHLAVVLVILGSRLASPPLAPLIPRQAPRILLWPYGEGRWHSLLDGMPFGVPALLITVCLTLAMPAGLLLLGDTLARHHVRHRHLARGAVYSLAVAGAWLLGLNLVRYGLRHAGGHAILDALTVYGVSMPVIGAAYALLLGFWWRAFLRDYLRLDQPGLIAAVMMLVAYLATFAGLLVLAIVSRSI